MPIVFENKKNKKTPMPKARPKSLKADKTQSLNKKFSAGVSAANKKAMGNVKKKAGGGKLKSVPEGNKGLSKLPTAVRNKMGYMKKGGKVTKKASGGLTKGMLGKDVLLGNKTPADVLKENKKKLLKKRNIKKGGK